MAARPNRRFKVRAERLLAPPPSMEFFDRVDECLAEAVSQGRGKIFAAIRQAYPRNGEGRVSL